MMGLCRGRAGTRGGRERKRTRRPVGVGEGIVVVGVENRREVRDGMETRCHRSWCRGVRASLSASPRSSSSPGPSRGLRESRGARSSRTWP